ncbi:MAG: 16S rRNA (cytosine(1402)-N(4))-methyltransferase RsmH [Candidatus Magasanikbacteria bacterium]|nr:16S rRNA (cytosine(1402)-N(4))-methyltransferase RsmH [Candidatus Magasanikbacteria bacterium]
MRHIPVLLNEVIDGLNLENNDLVIDCTLGDAGHSEAMVAKIGPKGKLLGIDADPESLLRAKNNLYKFEKQVVFARDNFANLEKIAAENDFMDADAILMDLGWSTPQFKERNRGFSFDGNEPLDMRYSTDVGETAADILNQYTLAELINIFKFYGEEKLSAEIAQNIIEQRSKKPFQTSAELTETVLQVYRKKLKTDKEIPWVGGAHPATQIFQALRIAVNKELEVVRQALPQALAVLKSGGRLAVITFHSLEDRIVKQYFVKNNNRILKIINKKPLVAGDEELKNNPSSRSAKLRIIEKI